MNKRPIDKTKKANIKCEHCEYWSSSIDDDKATSSEKMLEYCPKSNLVTTKCLNEKSPRYALPVHYWNRCKCFEWRK